MNLVRNRMRTEQEYIWGQSELIGTVLAGINDLLSLSNPSCEELGFLMYGVAHKVNFYDTGMDYIQSNSEEIEAASENLKKAYEQRLCGGVCICLCGPV